MIEAEMKCKIQDKDAVFRKLLSLGFQEDFHVKETDTYFDNEQGVIRNGDSALRIRETIDLSDGKRLSMITFKGKKMDLTSMTRPEFETEVESADTMEAILNALGYRTVQPVVVKERTQYSLERMHACLDTVDGLGDFLELEVMVETESERDDALIRMEDMLETLGFSLSDTTTTSYLSQLQKETDETGFQESLVTTFMEEMARRQMICKVDEEEDFEEDAFADMDSLERMEAELRRQVGLDNE